MPWMWQKLVVTWLSWSDFIHTAHKGHGWCSNEWPPIAVVEWLHSHRIEGCTPEAKDQAAAGSGHLSVAC